MGWRDYFGGLDFLIFSLTNKKPVEKIVTDADGLPIEFKGIDYDGHQQDFLFCGMQEIDSRECLYTPLYNGTAGHTLTMKTLKELYGQQYGVDYNES